MDHNIDHRQSKFNKDGSIGADHSAHRLTCLYTKRIVQALLLACSLSCLAAAAHAAGRTGRIQVQEEKLSVSGIQHEYEFFLIADTHISLCDERDQELMEKAGSRREAFERESGKSAVQTFQNLITESVKGDADLTIFAGDITDSAMYASIDFVQEQVNRLDMPHLYVTGNHDFEYGSEYFSKKAYREYFPRLQALTGTSEQYVIHEYEDLVVAGINDKNNQFSKRAVKALLPYMKGEKPVVLVMHVPLQPQYEDSGLEQRSNEVWGLSDKGRCRVLLGETACRPDKTTQELLDAVFAEDSPVAAVFAGHIHFYNRNMLNDRTDQIVTGAGYYGDAVRIHLTPDDSQ